MQRFLRINGNGHAFGREIGCACRRCTTINYAMKAPSGKLESFAGWYDPPNRAHTSASILTAALENADVVGSQVIIDLGGGVADSQMASGLRGLYNVSDILITHGEHADHAAAGQNAFFEGLRRSVKRAGQPFRPIPYFCTRVSYDFQRQERGQEFELTRFARFQEVVDGIPFNLVGDPAVRVTPIHVAHGWCKGAVIFCIEVDGKKVIIMWDIDTPESKIPSTERTNKDAIEAHKALLHGADFLFLATNTWSATGTGHTSYQAGRWYVDTLKPKQTYCIHASGHEDAGEETGFGWTDERWERELKKDGVNFARQGAIIPL